MSRLENVTGPVAYHAESPVWSLTWGGLRFVDLYRGDLLTLASTGLQRLHVADVAAFHRPRVDGGYVLAGARSLMLSSESGSVPWTPLTVSVSLAVGVRFNDGGCSPAGTLYAGTMAVDGQGNQGHLLRVTRDGCVSTVLTGVGISNGLGFSPDGRLAYYVDTATGRVDVFDNDEDELVRRRGFVDVVEDCRRAGGSGVPDGLCVDADGCVWVAVWGGSSVRCYAPEGTLERVVRVPAAQVSACTFGGEGLCTLFITTSREGLEPGQDPQAGSVFGLDTGTSGIPVAPFGG